jgi:5-deoxy-glucuronate isomerase
LEEIPRYERRPGYRTLVAPGQEGLQRLELGLLRVPRDEEFSFAPQEREAVLVILSGKCTLNLDGESWTLERVSVFAEPAMAAYVPRHRSYSVTASKPADLAVFMAEAMRDHLPRLVTRDDVMGHGEGTGEFRRQTYTIVGEEFPANRLLVGETYLDPGGWASYPPHKHDEERYPEEVRLEEAAYYQVDPPQGFGLQYVYSRQDHRSEVRIVRNDQAYAVVQGYHPLAAAPGYRLYYLWGMAGDGRVLRSLLDPSHAWVAEEMGMTRPEAVPRM